MALPLSNNAEGGTNGATVTTGNSGGTSGNAWDLVTIGTTCTAVYTTTAAHGLLAYAFTTGTTSGVSTAGWTTSVGTLSAVYGRAYVNLSGGLPATTDANIQHKGSGSSSAGNIQIDTGGHIVAQTPGFATAFTFTAAMSTATWYRIEWHMVAGAAGVGSMQVLLYSADSTSAIEQHTDNANAWGGTGTTITETDYGWTNSHPSQPTIIFDSIAIATTGFLGPDIATVFLSGPAAPLLQPPGLRSPMALAKQDWYSTAPQTPPPITPVTQPDAAGAAETLTFTVAMPGGDPSGQLQPPGLRSPMTLARRDWYPTAPQAAVVPTVTIPQADVAGAAETLTVTLLPADAAGAVDTVAVTVQASPADTAGATDKLTSPGTGNTAGAAESLSVAVTAILAGTGGTANIEAAGASESLTVVETDATVQLDVAAATESLAITQGTAPAPVPRAGPLPLASPAFIRSGMPRMHLQNLVTGQWLHRDVQGISAPSVTWNLNQPDTCTFTLAPPRPDLMDSTGNPLLKIWRDAVYLEEADTIRFGGLVTAMTANGPQLQVTATGFATYPTGIPYEGVNYTEYNIDALDVIRYLWNWVQSQPNSNVKMQIDTAKAGVLLGSHVTNLASSLLLRPSYPADLIPVSTLRTKNVIVASTQVVQRLWFGNASAFSTGMDIVLGTEQVRIAQVVTNPATSTATGAVLVTPVLTGRYPVGTQILQVQTHTTLARNASAGDASVWLGNAAAFAQGQVMLIGTRPYTVQTVLANTTTGVATGQVNIGPPLAENHRAGELVVLAPTPFQLLWWNSPDVGQEISSIQAEAVIDWHETHAWTSAAKEDVIHRMSFGVPRIGIRQTRLRFAEGENIIQAGTVTSDGSTFADEVIGLGAGSGSSQIRSTVSQLSGRLRRVQTYANQTVTTTARMSSIATRALTAALAQTDNLTQIVVKNHSNAPFGTFSPGDDIPVILASGWKSGLIWVRITAMTQDPVKGLMTLTVARSDSFTYMAQSGQAGTI